ncbi:wax ester/triacylglycerol synthase family O-acyltransferase [Actinokineospora sp. 24-640]
MSRTRLTGLDVAFLALERPASPMHLGAVGVFRPSAAADGAAVAALLAERAAAIPRLRAAIRPTLLGGAVWEPVPAFRAADHVRAFRLPAGHDLLATYVGAWQSRPLDLRRPPWEAHVVTGLPGGEFAVLLKLHHALADGAGAVEIAAGFFDGLGAAATSAAATSAAATSAPTAPRPVDLRSAVDIAGAVLRTIRLPWEAPLAAPSSPGRRFAMLRLDAADLRHVRRAHGGTVNDVVLAVLAGGLRTWLTETDRPVVPLRALIPVNTRARGGTGGNQISGYLCTLPVDVADPLVRLRDVRAVMDANKRSGPTKGAGALPLLADRVPALLHRLGTSLAAGTAPLLFDTVVTTVPFPALPLTLGDAELRAVYPVVPLAAGHPVGIAVSPYRDGVHIGLNADAATAPDVDLLATAIAKAAVELHERC